jgi:hypothetical protein
MNSFVFNKISVDTKSVNTRQRCVKRRRNVDSVEQVLTPNQSTVFFFIFHKYTEEVLTTVDALGVNAISPYIAYGWHVEKAGVDAFYRGQWVIGSFKVDGFDGFVVVKKTVEAKTANVGAKTGGVEGKTAGVGK